MYASNIHLCEILENIELNQKSLVVEFYPVLLQWYKNFMLHLCYTVEPQLSSQLVKLASSVSLNTQF